jgi:hypothetical protein
MSSLNITIITDLEDLINYVFDYTRQIEADDYGFENKRLTELPNVLKELMAWENKNLQILSSENKERFYLIKQSIEKLMERFNIDTPEILISKN